MVGIQAREAPVSNAQFAEFQNIVHTRTLPAGTQFEVLRGYQPTNQMEFTVWSVRIRMPHGMAATLTRFASV